MKDVYELASFVPEREVLNFKMPSVYKGQEPIHHCSLRQKNLPFVSNKDIVSDLRVHESLPNNYTRSTGSPFHERQFKGTLVQY